MTTQTEQVQATKRCGKCYADKIFSEFSKTKRNPDGHQRYCKACCKQYKQENRKKLSAYQKKWCAENKERLSEYGKDYYAANLSKKAEQHRATYFKIKNDPVRYEKHLERMRRLNRASQLKYPEKQKARKAVVLAIKSGKLIRPESCSACMKTCVPEAHHDSYDQDKRLDVRWLCKQCHEAHHRKYQVNPR
jgi:transposase-like protein